MSRIAISKTKRPQLNAERIAAAALALVDAGNLESLSFRLLAKALKCEAMSLYHYYPSKAHLLDAMVDLYFAEMKWSDPSLPWQQQLRFMALEYRAAALRHPGFFQFISVYRMNSRAGLAMLNDVLEIYAASGLSVEMQARHFRVLGYYLMGACLDETQGYAKGPSSASPVPMEEARASFPAIMAVGRFFAPEYHQTTFATGIDVLIAETERELARHQA